MAEVNVDDCFIDHCDSAENHIGSSAVERARVLMQHIRASNDTFPTSSNQMNCKSIDDNFATNEYLCDASPPNKLSGKPSETKKTTNWLDVLKIDPKLYWPKKYRYTFEPRPGTSFALSIKEREFYEENGYLIMKNLIPKNILIKLQKNSATPLLSSSPSSSMLLNQAMSDQVLKEFIFSPQLTKYLKCFCGHNIMAMRCQKVFDTEYNKSNNFQCDLPCLAFRPADRIVGIWASLDSIDNSMQTGLTVIPGSHRIGLLENECLDESGIPQTVVYERMNDVHQLANNLADKKCNLILNPGDVLFYHPMLVYSPYFRPTNNRAIAVHGNFASSECYFTVTESRKDFRAQIPPLLHSLVSIEQDQFVVKQDNWKDKGMLVAGKRINL